MITEYEKQQLANRVSNELALICKFYKVDFFALDKTQMDMLIEIFQAGVGFLEKTKKEEIDKNIKEFNSEEIPF